MRRQACALLSDIGMLRFAVALVALMALAPTSSALAQDGPLNELGDPSLLAPERPPLPPVRRPPALGAPIALTVVGAIASGAGIITLFAAGLHSVDGLDTSSPEVIVGAGTVVLALGLPVFFAGLYWLIEQVDGARSERASRPLLIRF